MTDFLLQTLQSFYIFHMRHDHTKYIKSCSYSFWICLYHGKETKTDKIEVCRTIHLLQRNFNVLRAIVSILINESRSITCLANFVPIKFELEGNWNPRHVCVMLLLCTYCTIKMNEPLDASYCLESWQREVTGLQGSLQFAFLISALFILIGDSAGSFCMLVPWNYPIPIQ